MNMQPLSELRPDTTGIWDPLDIELERCGWKERARHFDRMCVALAAHDTKAFDEARDDFWNTESLRDGGEDRNSSPADQ